MEIEETNDAEEKRHLNEVLFAFKGYGFDMLREVDRREANILRHPSLVEKLPGGALGVQNQHEALRETVRKNQSLFNSMIRCNKFTTAGSNPEEVHPDLATEVRNLSKVRSTLHQCAREWSSEGAEEREKTFKPLLDFLEKYVPQDPQKRVLVPGSGLGRLPAEVLGRGYSCQGNEFSYQMLLMCEFILNELTSSAPENQVEIHPWIHNPSNVRNIADLMRSVRIPDCSASDILARYKPPSDDVAAPEMSMCAGEFVEIYKKQVAEWDAVLTCFFIDTASNVLDYIQVIHAALKPGGVWVNGGPLLWHWQSNGPKGGASSMSDSDRRYAESVELSWDQLRHVILHAGFEILEEKWQQVTYTSNTMSMMQSVYNIVQFVAKKLD